MGLISRIHKRTIANDEQGIAPLIVAMLILATIAGTAVVGSLLLAQPDITYNISDTGFSIAGVEIDSLWLILAGIGVIVLLWFGFRKK